MLLFPGVVPASAPQPLPPNTILLSQMMRELSTQPGFTEHFLQIIEGGGSGKQTSLLTPDLVDHLRRLIVGKDWQGLDRFPGWTMAEITPTVGALTHIAPANDAQKRQQLANFLELGPYTLQTGGTLADLRQPSTLPDFAHADIPTDIGYGITRPDGPNDLAVHHPDSQRLAYLLNRLAANGLDGVPAASVAWNQDHTADTPDALIQAMLATGHSVTVVDHRAVANFGQMHFRGQEVMMPFFLNSQILIPGTKRPLLVPASHAEYEWHIRGPQLNADVSFFFAIDGKAQWRTMDEADQAWVMGRDAHTYTGADAIEVTRLSAAVLRTWMHLHAAHPQTPFNGYYAFGVCQDVVAAIELKMTGAATLFPNTADDTLFTDPRDAEINALIRRLPKDRAGKPPEVERIFATLPIGSSDAELAKVTIPGLGPDLVAVHDGWTNGTLKRTGAPWVERARTAAFLFAIAIGALFVLRWKRRLR
jgi:hypothetical protein